MSTYGATGTLTYGQLFGGGTALYGAYGASSAVTVARPTKYNLIEQSAAFLTEQSGARLIELSSAEARPE